MRKYDPLSKFKDNDKVSIWKRGFAFIIDVLIIQFIVSLSFNSLIDDELDSKNFIESLQYSINNYETLAPKLLIISITTAILALIYFTLLEWKLQQTVGKMILKIKVVSDLKRLEFYQALLRNVPKALFFTNYTLWIALFDLIYHSFTGRRYFDKLAKTNVVNV